MRNRRSLSSKLALSWMDCASRDERMPVSTTSSPINSRRDRELDADPLRVLLASAFRQAACDSVTQLEPCAWKARNPSRFSCMSRALPTCAASATSRSRIAWATGSITPSVAATKRSRVSRESWREEAWDRVGMDGQDGN